MAGDLGEAHVWKIEFFVTTGHLEDSTFCPASMFLESIPKKVEPKIWAVLVAVSLGPPPKYRGAEKWRVMHDEMVGIYEVRVSFGDNNYRLFCVLDNSSDRVGEPAIVCLGGLVKPKRTGASKKDYERIRNYRDEFRKFKRSD